MSGVLNTNQGHVSTVNGQAGAVQIGIRNYARGPSFSKTYPSNSEHVGIFTFYRPEMAKAGDVVTLSALLKCEDISFTGGTPVVRFQAMGYPDGTSYASDIYSISGYNSGSLVSGSFTHIISAGDSSFMLIVSLRLSEAQASQDYWKCMVAIRNFSGITTGTVSVSEMMFQIGTVSTDWTPAPEDFETRLAAIEAKLGITADPPMIDGPDMEEDMDMDEIRQAGGYNALTIVGLLPALIGGVRHG